MRSPTIKEQVQASGRTTGEYEVQKDTKSFVV